MRILTHRRLSRTVPPDDPDNLARLYIERNILQRPEVLRGFMRYKPPERGLHRIHYRIPDRGIFLFLASEHVLLAQVPDADRGVIGGHVDSYNCIGDGEIKISLPLRHPSDTPGSHDRKVKSQHDHTTLLRDGCTLIAPAARTGPEKTIRCWKDRHIRLIRTG